LGSACCRWHQGRVRTNIGSTRRRFGSRAYAELVAQVENGGAQQTADTANAPDVVARVFVDALEDGSARVRYPGTPDAAGWWHVRAARDDDGYRRYVWDSYRLDW
jgi:hypothetical protein